MINSRILIADSNETSSYLLKEELVGQGYRADIVYGSKKIPERLKKNRYELLLIDPALLDSDELEILKYLKEYYPSIQILLLISKSQIRNSQKYFKLGVYDIITRPYEPGLAGAIIERALEHKALLSKNKLLSLKMILNATDSIIGENESMKDLIDKAQSAAQSESNILIIGEAGTEKKLLAELIHRYSRHSDKPFAALSCSSKPDLRIEAEIFGTDASTAGDSKPGNQGLLEIVSGGTLLLEEISNIKLSVQTELLRFLETGEFHRSGGSTNIGSSARIISTVTKKISEETRENNFLQDLFSKLSFLTLTIPPLRDRGGDILLISEYLLQKKSPARFPKKLSTDAKKKLLNYHFPGNVFELEMIIDRAVILSEEELIRATDLSIIDENEKLGVLDKEDHKVMSLEEIEKFHILRVLDFYDWNREKSARDLGISLKTLYTKIRAYGLK